MQLSAIENELVRMLVKKGPITGAVQVAHALWPDREMTPQGAAASVREILRRVQNMGFIEIFSNMKPTRYEATEAGRAALAAAQEGVIEQPAHYTEKLKNRTNTKRAKQAVTSVDWVDNLKKNDGWRIVLDLDAECARELKALVADGFGSQGSEGRKTARAAVQQAIHDAFKNQVASKQNV